MKLTKNEQNTLEKYADTALTYACKKVHRLGKRNEVSVTASIATFGAYKIMKLWGAFLINKGYKVSVQTSFCHQTPYLRIQNLPKVKKGSEIGDLLFVVQEKDSSKLKGEIFQQALLLQAKKQSNSSSDIIIQKSDSQYRLYNDWEHYKYTGGHLKDVERKLSFIDTGVPARGHHQGAKYLLIKEAKRTSKPLKTDLLLGDAVAIRKQSGAKNVDVIQCTDRLSGELVQMLLQKRGLPLYGFTAQNRTPYLKKGHVYNCSWSMIIHDILDNSRQKLMGKSLTYPSKKRIDRNNLYTFINDGIILKKTIILTMMK
ncbi:hypothetical protein AJGP001_03550 [Planococcus faecalis]|uniref:Uncharacterized protein n=1 Tax=Planococcus faecalis TaxID=1598147 RepID=A0ABM6IPX2_9BACL|nr:hypothetical protein [Planococcus faecalis]AQU78427.1 hypothetical protein AJGP001_03550 [Planococcus faecalis]